MAEQVFEIAALKKRVLELLRRHDRPMTTGAVALELGVPLYAADTALEVAYMAGEVEFTAGVGWNARQQEPAVRVDEGQGAINFGGEGS